ncbi:ATP-binding cassette domain-containing protein [Alienimonas sp. DA493]|uniref:ATP-binding cassette domain-containing protein n=1 Tax=Alienimonas sp. DA493 TaxID=3373605 RepID=UPI00375500BD
MISVRDLSKSFDVLSGGRVVALEGVSFEVRPGEIFGLLGPNGAGKSTCLRILSTVLQPTGGSATVAGYDVLRDPAEVRRSIGFLSNNTGLYDRMTAWELVEYFGRLHGLEGNALERRMTEVFETLRMTDFSDSLCSRMSTGQRQKVSIARALVHDPPALIFDEPTAGLDVLVARAVLNTVAALRDAGKCIIFSTHIMREVEKLCDRVAVIHRGRILDQGPLPELAARHDEPDTEELFFKLIEEEEEAEFAGLSKRPAHEPRPLAV